MHIDGKPRRSCVYTGTALSESLIVGFNTQGLLTASTSSGASGRDSLEFRFAHLDESDADQVRFAGGLKLVAEKAGWDRKIEKDKGRGIAADRSGAGKFDLCREGQTYHQIATGG